MTALADEYWAYRVSSHHWENLIMGKVSHLESWADHSVEGIDDWRSTMSSFAQRAQDAAPVSAADQILSETVAACAFYDAATGKWWSELSAPNAQVGLVAMLLPSLHLQPLVTAEHGEKYLSKIAAFGQLIDHLVDRLADGAATGIVPIDVHVRQTIEKIDDLSNRPTDPVATQRPPIEMSEAEADAWRSTLTAAIEESYRPALRRYRDALGSITLGVARTADRPGLCHLAGGDEVYAQMIAAHTTLGQSPEAIHQIGLDQIAHLEERYVAMGGPLLGTTDIAEIYGRLRDDPELHYDTADEVVADSLRCLEKAAAAMGDWFDPVPQAECVATATDVGAMAYYRPPSADGSMPGQFFFNVADPSAWARFQVPAIAYHEGIPGHHLQFALGIENDRVHDLHREMYLSVYGEGWGLYTEQLADEMGLYADDWERIGMLMADSMRAGRLVVDTGLHAMGWTRSQAIAYLADHSPMAMHEISEEIDRYIAAPGQALSYMIGRLEIQDIRAEAEAELGDAFDVKAFHGVVLGNGTVPMPTLRRMVGAWAMSRS